VGLGGRERAAIGAVPAGAWQIAVDARGEVRERRADQACGDLECARRRCWIEDAHVTELTSLLRDGPAGDQLGGRSEAMRVFARRERPHPGAQLTLFEAGDGWRYSLRVTNRPAVTKGWLGQNAYLDVAHRVHARVEDAVRTGKDCGIGKFPFTSSAVIRSTPARFPAPAGLVSRAPGLDVPPDHPASQEAPHGAGCHSLGGGTRLADAAGPDADPAFAAAVAGLRQHSTPYHLAHGLLDHAAHLLRMDDSEAAGAAIGEARDIAGRLRCQPLLDRAADLTPAASAHTA